MDVQRVHKQTEVGLIPEDWDAVPLAMVTTDIGDGIHTTPVYSSTGDYYFINGNNLRDGRIVFSEGTKTVNYSEFAKHRKDLSDRSILMSINGTIGNLGMFHGEAVVLGKSAAYLNVKRSVSKLFVYHSIQTEIVKRQFSDGMTGTTIRNLGLATIKNTKVPLPRTRAEQEAVAEALSDADAFIESLEQLIVKKRDLKQSTMQELLTGKKRLPGFRIEPAYQQTEVGVIPVDWEVKALAAISECLDNLRVPLNESQRARRRGNIPYCGANGVLDYIDHFVIDDDIILMAEDGGYFDEYLTRPIAYRIRGKCWVNNHAHILKTKTGTDQSFIFYSLVHKNILRFLASGTRAKLNRSELNKIEVPLPPTKAEQIAISAILSDIDAEINVLEAKLVKARDLKQGMMQELLTGRIRLV